MEGLIFIGNIPTERHPLRHWMAVFGLAEIDGRWVEMIHKADQAIFNPQLNFFSKTEDALRGSVVGLKTTKIHHILPVMLHQR